MDVNFFAQEFERASIELQNGNTREDADKFLKKIADMPEALLICKNVLDGSRNDLAHFHASSTIKRRIPQDFFVISKEEISVFRDYLFQYCLTNSSLPNHTNSTLLQSTATICKFSWVRDGEEAISGFLDSILSLPLQEEHEKYTVLVFTNSLLEEMIENCSVQFGLSNELHLRCKHEFQDRYLLKVFLSVSEISKKWLDSLSSNETNVEEPRVGHLVCKLLERLILWDFDEVDDFLDDGEAASHMRGFVSANTLPDDWKPYVTSPSFLDLIFSLNNSLLSLPEARSPLSQVMIALSNLDSEQFQSDQERMAFTERFSFYLNNILTSNHSIYDQEETYLLTVSQLVSGVLCSFNLSNLLSVPGVSVLLQHAADLTLNCLRLTLKETDDTCAGESFDFLIDMWATLVRQVNNDERSSFLVLHRTDESSEDTEAGFRTFIHQFCLSLFESYIETKIKIATDEISSGLNEPEGYYKDWALHEDELMNLAILARAIPEKSLTILIELFEKLFEQLRGIFSAHELHPEDLTLPILYEHIHWLLLISGFVLADSGTGELVSIPNSLNNVSSQKTDQSLDPVIRLPELILSMVDFLTFDRMDVKNTWCSSKLAETFFWFIERWTQTYLFPNKEGYLIISKNILDVFGTSSFEQAGRLVLDMLLDKIWKNYLMWESKSGPLTQIARVLLHLVSRKESRLVLFNSQKFIEISATLMGTMNSWIHIANSIVVQSILLIATGTSNGETRQVLLHLVKNKLEEQIKLLVDIFNQKGSSSVDPQSVGRIHNILEILHGFALANESDNCLTLFHCYVDYLPVVLDFISVSKSKYEIWSQALVFLNSLTKNLDLFDFEADDLSKFSHFFHKLLEKYIVSYPEIDRTTSHIDVTSEHSPELCDALESICNLAFLDRSLGEGEGHECVINLIFHAISHLFPLITQENLQGPVLASCFLSVIALIAEQFPQYLADLPLEFMDSIMSSLIFSQENLPYESAHISYSSVFIMGLHAFKTDHSYLSGYLSKQLQITFSNLLFRKINGNLFESASEVILVLLLTQPNQFHEFKETAISQWISPEHSQLFREEIDNLYEIALSCGKLLPNRRPAMDPETFMDALIEFLRKVYPFISSGVASLNL